MAVTATAMRLPLGHLYSLVMKALPDAAADACMDRSPTFHPRVIQRIPLRSSAKPDVPSLMPGSSRGWGDSFFCKTTPCKVEFPPPTPFVSATNPEFGEQR